MTTRIGVNGFGLMEGLAAYAAVTAAYGAFMLTDGALRRSIPF